MISVKLDKTKIYCLRPTDGIGIEKLIHIIEKYILLLVILFLRLLLIPSKRVLHHELQML